MIQRSRGCLPEMHSIFSSAHTLRKERMEAEEMVEDDTIKLLRECDAGVKMGISSINEVLGEVQNQELSRILKNSRDAHERLDGEVNQILQQYQDEGKEPSAVAQGMSWMKTSMKMAMEKSDRTVADLMTDGCNMGIKSLRKYKNQYPAAEQRVRDLTDRLIALEENMVTDMRAYL